MDTGYVNQRYNRKTVVISIDLGSNTLRLIEYDGVFWGKSFEKIVRTAEGLNQTHNIGKLALERVLNGLYEAKKTIDFTAHEVVAITTAAMRMADNSEEILEEIRQKTGINFRIINGDEEARLTLMAVQNRLNMLNLSSNELILIDIGGGSTEVVVVSKNKIVSKSFPLGIVTLSERSQTSETMDHELEFYREKIALYIQSLALESTPKTLVLTAGTPTTIAAYLLGMDYQTYDANRINGTLLKRSDCTRVLNELLEMDEATRSRYVGVGREQLIVVGIQIVEMMFDAFALNNAIVIDDGLREGVALEYFNSKKL
ncbi:MAG: phosphatase [Campylobacterales bacterium]|nr:phosphatase [Campylobacterales bacterium]